MRNDRVLETESNCRKASRGMPSVTIPAKPPDSREALGRTTSPSSREGNSSVDDAEVAKFTALAAEWWDPNGKFRPLHRFNPVRLQFIPGLAIDHFGRDQRNLKPFTGLSLLDIGCGGGLLSEPMARLGFTVLGADPSEKNVGTRRAPAAHTGPEGGYS